MLSHDLLHTLSSRGARCHRDEYLVTNSALIGDAAEGVQRHPERQMNAYGSGHVSASDSASSQYLNVMKPLSYCGAL
jgi:hypothetical protein